MKKTEKDDNLMRKENSVKPDIKERNLTRSNLYIYIYKRKNISNSMRRRKVSTKYVKSMTTAKTKREQIEQSVSALNTSQVFTTYFFSFIIYQN